FADDPVPLLATADRPQPTTGACFTQVPDFVGQAIAVEHILAVGGGGTDNPDLEVALFDRPALDRLPLFGGSEAGVVERRRLRRLVPITEVPALRRVTEDECEDQHRARHDPARPRGGGPAPAPRRPSPPVGGDAAGGASERRPPRARSRSRSPRRAGSTRSS